MNDTIVHQVWLKWYLTRRPETTTAHNRSLGWSPNDRVTYLPRSTAAEAKSARSQQLGIVDAVWSAAINALIIDVTMLVLHHSSVDAQE